MFLSLSSRNTPPLRDEWKNGCDTYNLMIQNGDVVRFSNTPLWSKSDNELQAWKSFAQDFQEQELHPWQGL